LTNATGARPGLTLAAVAVVQFMVSLDLAVVNVALPRIADALGFSTVGLTWVIHAYALTFGGMLLLGGKLADRFGRKCILLIGLALFGMASFLGGLAEEPGQLVAARAAQGVGATAATFPGGKARVKAFGVWSATNAFGGRARCRDRRASHRVRRLALGDVGERAHGAVRPRPGPAGYCR
jgi:MFS family permease